MIHTRHLGSVPQERRHPVLSERPLAGRPLAAGRFPAVPLSPSRTHPHPRGQTPACLRPGQYAAAVLFPAHPFD